MLHKQSLSALIGIVGLQVSLQAQARFPSTIHTLRAPVGGLSVRWVEASSSSPHRLILQGRAGKPPTLLQFERSVRVYWSPNGEALAVTNYEGSDQASTWIFRVAQAPDSVHLDLASAPDSVRHAPCIARGHTYLEAVRWVDGRTLTVRLRSRDQAEHVCPVHSWTYVLR
jgi:hypothetical protein